MASCDLTWSWLTQKVTFLSRRLALKLLRPDECMNCVSLSAKKPVWRLVRSWSTAINIDSSQVRTQMCSPVSGETHACYG